MALFERKPDAENVSDAATRALSVAVVENAFVEAVYDKVSIVYDLTYGPTLHPGRLQAIEPIGFKADLDLPAFLVQADLHPVSIEKVNWPRIWSLVTCVKS